MSRVIVWKCDVEGCRSLAEGVEFPKGWERMVERSEMPQHKCAICSGKGPPASSGLVPSGVAPYGEPLRRLITFDDDPV
jgi:hypothetical protein